MKYTDEILLSLHPKYWDLIKAGKKTIEIRKTKPQGVHYPFRVFVYLTGGIGVVGCFDCDSIKMTLDFKQFVDGSCLTEKELSEYSNGKPLCGWHIKENSVCEYETAFPLEMATGFTRPPQSWQYMKKESEYE